MRISALDPAVAWGGVAGDPGGISLPVGTEACAIRARAEVPGRTPGDRLAGTRSTALARLFGELDSRSCPAATGPISGATRHLEARVAAAVLGAAAFERPRAGARSGDLFRVDPAEADVAELVRPGEAKGMVSVRPVLRSLDAAVQLARDGGIDAGWALRLSLRQVEQHDGKGGPAAPAIAARLCRYLVLARLVEEVAGPAVDPGEGLAPFEREVLMALAAAPEPVAASEVGQLVADDRGRKGTVTAALWRLRHLGLAELRSGSWRCMARGHRMAGRLGGARRTPDGGAHPPERCQPRTSSTRRAKARNSGGKK